jgi:hypothetical protein
MLPEYICVFIGKVGSDKRHAAHNEHVMATRIDGLPILAELMDWYLSSGVAFARSTTEFAPPPRSKFPC